MRNRTTKGAPESNRDENVSYERSIGVPKGEAEAKAVAWNTNHGNDSRFCFWEGSSLLAH